MKMSTQDILDLQMESDIGDTTIRGFLEALLQTLWEDGEGFSGKRPFGSGCWESQIYLPLVKAGVIKGTLDEDGYLDTVDKSAGNKLISNVIKEIFQR